MKSSTFHVFINFFVLIILVASKKSLNDNKPEWAKKDIRDYSEADLERLLDQWEVRWFYVYFLDKGHNENCFL